MPVHGRQKFLFEAVEFRDGDTTDFGIELIGAKGIAESLA